ncbi:MAG: hypothetical protein ACFFBP_00755 [Promethearchaeota archaeon]
MAPLEPLDIANGILGLIFVSITIIVGLSIVIKYFKNKNINLLYVGIAWIFFCSGWYGTSVSFIWSFFNGGEGLPLEAILLINFIPLPIGVVSWMMAFTNFMLKKRQKLILLSIIIYSVVFYTLFVIYLILDVNLIADKESAVDTSSKSIEMASFIIIIIVIIMISGIAFAIKTIKIGESETKWKGVFLLIAFPSFAIGGLLDAILPTNASSLVILRLLLMSSAIEFYFGFILPERIKRFLTN